MSAPQSKKPTEAEIRKYLEVSVDPYLKPLISDLMKKRPENVLQFFRDWIEGKGKTIEQSLSGEKAEEKKSVHYDEVKKSIVILAQNDIQEEEPKAEEPKAEEPKAEEPKAEEPKAEEPKAEEPKAEEPKAEEPKAEEPKAEEPKAEEPKAEEPKAETEESKAEAEEAKKSAVTEEAKAE